MKENIDVLIIDTLSSSMLGRENDAHDMSKVIDGMRRFNDEGIAVLLIHHEGKDSRQGARGSSRITGAVDSIAKMTKNKGGLKLSFEGLRYSAKLEDIHLYLDAGTLIFRRTEGGKAITKCSEDDVFKVIGSDTMLQKDLIDKLMKRCDCKKNAATTAIKSLEEKELLSITWGGPNNRTKHISAALLKANP